jgi:hypothetical protein
MSSRRKRSATHKSPPQAQSTLTRDTEKRTSTGSPAHKKADERPTPKSHGRGGGLNQNQKAPDTLTPYAILQEIEDGLSSSSEGHFDDAKSDDMTRTSNVDPLILEVG